MASQQDIILAVGFEEIQTSIFRKTTLDKGTELFQANHVGKVRERKIFLKQCDKDKISRSTQEEVTFRRSASLDLFTSSESIITGDVIAQTSVAKLYHVTLKINEERKIVEKFCTCKVGRDQCKHQAAVCVFINNDTASRTKTCQAQTWDKPSMKSNEYKRGKRVVDFCLSSTPLLLLKTISKDAPLNFLSQINSFNCPLKLMLQAESKNSDDLAITGLLREVVYKIATNEAKDSAVKIIFKETTSDTLIYSATEAVESNISSKKLVMAVDRIIDDNLSQFYRERVCVNVEKAKEIFYSSMDQSKSILWRTERLYRITSTKAGKIITRKTNFEKLAENLSTDINVNVPAIRYGNKMEPQAKRHYTQETEANIEVLDCGLVISHRQPWLACSPDGLILNRENKETDCEKLLEVKCPYSCKGKNILNYETRESMVAYLYFEGDIPKLKKNHIYYTQVQIAMYVTGVKNCEFYVYSRCQSVRISIGEDETFLVKAIPKIEKFYFRFYLPLVKTKVSNMLNCK